VVELGLERSFSPEYSLSDTSSHSFQKDRPIYPNRKKNGYVQQLEGKAPK
jgi:hypothetical protein